MSARTHGGTNDQALLAGLVCLKRAGVIGNVWVSEGRIAVSRPIASFEADMYPLGRAVAELAVAAPTLGHASAVIWGRAGAAGRARKRRGGVQ